MMDDDRMEPLNVYASNIDIVVRSDDKREEHMQDSSQLDASFDDEIEMSP